MLVPSDHEHEALKRLQNAPISLLPIQKYETLVSVF
jgi:hypothetical protein